MNIAIATDGYFGTVERQAIVLPRAPLAATTSYQYDVLLFAHTPLRLMYATATLTATPAIAHAAAPTAGIAQIAAVIPAARSALDNVFCRGDRGAARGGVRTRG